MAIKLGTKVTDRITGFTGIAIAKTEWLYGCTRYGVQSDELGKDGKPIEAEWFDERSLSSVSRQRGGPCSGKRETG